MTLSRSAQADGCYGTGLGVPGQGRVLTCGVHRLGLIRGATRCGMGSNYTPRVISVSGWSPTTCLAASRISSSISGRSVGTVNQEL